MSEGFSIASLSALLRSVASALEPGWYGGACHLSPKGGIEPNVPGTWGCSTCEGFELDRITVLCRSRSLRNPWCASFAGGRPESVIGNRLLSSLSLLVSVVDSPFVGTPRLFAFCPPRCGIE